MPKAFQRLAIEQEMRALLAALTTPALLELAELLDILRRAWGRRGTGLTFARCFGMTS